MAKYEDYDQQDTLEAEITDAATSSEERSAEIPPQFAGKSVEEVAQSYQELKSMSDRQANELGELRVTTNKLTSQLLHSSPSDAPTQNPEQSITVDDLYENPEAAIDRRVDAKVSAKLEGIEQRQRDLELRSGYADLRDKYPTYQDQAQSPEMRNWIAESNYRKRLAVAADSGDLEAADDLFGMYNDLTQAQEEPPEPPPTPNVREASLESGRTEVAGTVEKFSRAKLELARIKKRQGDREADAWLKQNAVAIRTAYEEGRIVN